MVSWRRPHLGLTAAAGVASSRVVLGIGLVVAIVIGLVVVIAAPWSHDQHEGSGTPLPTAALSAASASTRGPSTSSPTVGLPDYPDWPTYHGDNVRSGYYPASPAVTGTPHADWTIRLDGAVYGSPVFVDHGIAIAATENNSVYRLSDNGVVWRTHLGEPVPRSSLPCGDIDPTGITSTPAYDPTTNTLIVVTLQPNPIRHIAYGIDPVDGAVRWSRPVDVPASVPGIAAEAMQQRGALVVSGREVYVPYGGLDGDCGSYRGSVVGLDLDHPGSASLTVFTVPTSREGGIWATAGPSVSPDGGLLVAVGNGATAESGQYDSSDSVLRIQQQTIVDSFSPATWRTDNRDDLDLGSEGPAVVGNWVFIAGKSGVAYLLDRSHLGGIGGQLSSMPLCAAFGGPAVVGSTVYVPCTDGLRAVRISSTGSMQVLWHASTSITGSPVVAGGRVWSLDTSAGVLHMLDPATGRDLGGLPVGAVTRFASPSVYGPAVFVPTKAGVTAYRW